MYNYYEYKKSKYIKNYLILFIGILIVILGVTYIFNILNNKNISIREFENSMVKKANNYIEKNQIIIPEDQSKYLSFSEIDYKFPTDTCSNNGGISVFNEAGELQYVPYYICNKYMSESIEELIKSNDNSLIELNGNNPYILKHDEKYLEYSYDKKKDVTVTIDNPVLDKPGVYLVTYNVMYNEEETTVTRVVIKEGKEVSDKEISYYPSVSLNGEEVIFLLKGQEYIEENGTATDYYDGDISANLKIIGNVNTNIKGTYILKYQVTNSKGKISTRYRTIIVNDAKLSMIKLNGSSNIKIKKGDTYIEPGYLALYNGKDITESVVVSGEVDTNTIGTYHLIYTVTNQFGQTDNVVRKVSVTYASGSLTPSYTLSVTKDPINTTSEDVVIYVNGEYEYIILPNGTKVTEKETEYVVDANGQYKFEAFYLNGTSKVTTVNVTNIDKSIPTGSCILKNNIITVVFENTGVFQYAYSTDDISYTSYMNNKSYQVGNGKVTAYVKVKNTAGTESKFVCGTSGIVKPMVEVPSNYKDNIIMNADSETLKVRVVKSGSWYMTYMWMKDPNKQHIMVTKNDVGGSSIGNMINNTASKNFMGIKNKIAVAVNSDYPASAWGLPCNKGTSYPAIPLVINHGKVIKKNYSNDCIDHVNGKVNDRVTWIDSDGNLQQWENKSSYTKEQREAKFNEIIASGTYNTFGSVFKKLVYAGVNNIANNKDDSALRVALCQIDSNNYIQFVTTSSVSKKDIAKRMIKLGCTEGVNIDGGGSTSFGYKKGNNSSFTKVTYSSRPNYAISVFTELDT